MNLAITLMLADRRNEALAVAAPDSALHAAFEAASRSADPRIIGPLADPEVRGRRNMAWPLVNLFLVMDQPDSAAAALLAGAHRGGMSIANFARDPYVVKALRGQPAFEEFVRLVKL